MTKTIIFATAIAVGAMTPVAHSANKKPKAPAIDKAVENAGGGGEMWTLSAHLKKVLKSRKPTSPEVARKWTGVRVDNTATGSIKVSAFARSRPNATESGPAYHSLVSRYAAEFGVPVALAHAVITVESNYRASARGSAGEVGLMQIKPATARGLGYHGTIKALYDPETNIRYGMKYLAKAYELGGGSTCGAILRYNAGHAATRMNPVSSAYCAKVKRILNEK